MKFLILILFISILSVLLCKQPNEASKTIDSKLPTQNNQANHLKKQPLQKQEKNQPKAKRTKSKGFIYDGEVYTQEQVKMSSYAGNCYIRYNSTIYDLTKLSNYGPFYMNTINGGKVEFDVCKNVIAQCNHAIKGLVVTKEGAKCRQFSNAWTFDKKWTWENMENFNLEFPEGEVCNPYTQEKFKVQVKFKCNLNATAPKIINDGAFNDNACRNYIIAETAEGKFINR